MTDDRAVSSVLGIVMIVAITVAAITSLAVIGTVALNESQEQAELSRMETSMAQMSSKASLTALGDAGMQRFDLGTSRNGQMTVNETAGSVTIEYVNGSDEPTNENTTEIFHSDTLGALEYEQGDHTIAYQGGGVWAKTGDDGGRMISPPEYHYMIDTLTFPVINVTGEGSSSLGKGQVKKVDSQTYFPTDEFPNPLTNATVYVEIESEYHRGWHEFFQTRSDGEVQHDPANQIVRAELTALFETNFNGPVAVHSHYDVHRNVDDSDFREGQLYPSASQSDESFRSECEDWESLSGEETITEGTYCWEDATIGDTTFDTSDGDITIVMKDGLDMDDEDVEVTGSNSVRVFVDENIKIDGNAEFSTSDDAFFLMYAHSDVEEVVISGGPTIHGVIYAPSSNVELLGSSELVGSIIADTFRGNSNAIDIAYDERLDDVDAFGFDHPLDEIRYLHLTENSVEITFE